MSHDALTDENYEPSWEQILSDCPEIIEDDERFLEEVDGMKGCLTTLAKLREQGASARAIRKVASSVLTDGTPGANFYVEAAKAFARLDAPKLSELERAEKVIVRAARLLDHIVTGSLKDNGTDYDKLCAASIRRHLPGIVGSAIQLGIDVRKVEAYFKGANNDSVSFHLGQQPEARHPEGPKMLDRCHRPDAVNTG